MTSDERDYAFMQLKGVAASRAHQWVTGLRARNIRGAWDSAKALEIARRKVADLARDAELRERLARECAEAAEREWLCSPLAHIHGK